MALSEEVVEGVVFPAAVRPPGSGCTHFLAGAGACVRALPCATQQLGTFELGVSAVCSSWVTVVALRADDAGVRGLEIEGNFVKFAAIGVYLENAAAPALSGKWSGKSADELAADAAFFRDIYTGKKKTMPQSFLLA